MIVISFGGSLLYSGKNFDEEFAKKASVVLTSISTRQKTAVVVGGGFLAAKNAEKARNQTQNEFFADVSAIKATRSNAKKMLSLIGKDAVFPRVLKSPDSFITALREKNLALCGGFLPGLTTDACAVLVAEATNASKVINASKINAVYTSDPAKDPTARPIAQMSFEQLVDLAVKGDSRHARTNFVFDVIAAKLAARSKMPVEFVDGKNLELLEKVANGEAHGGTIVI